MIIVACRLHKIKTVLINEYIRQAMKTFITIGVLIISVTLSYAFVATSHAEYENLQVLPKNTNKYQMDSIMKHFTYSLGINCYYCHVQLNNAMRDWDFASDNNENKKTAREMLRMTIDLNKTYFKEYTVNHFLDANQAITCYSCHRGEKIPATFPGKKNN